MNAPAPAAAIAAAPTLQFVPIAKLRPSRTHIQALRRQRFDKKALEELAESIKKVGILQPLVGRPWHVPTSLNRVPSDPTHEIVAGERRYIAAKAAGLAEVPVNVAELTDEQVLEIQLIENLQREGLHELEEAEGYEELMELKGINADALAELVGKSRSYVYARTKLLALCPEARKAFYAGDLDASKALLVARIGHHDTQRQALKDLTKRSRWDEGGLELPTYKAALEHIREHYMLQLGEAPFDVKDGALLPKAGTCAACPKRTGNQRELFADVKSADVCTDPKCFADKKAAHQARIRADREKAGETVIAGPEARKLLPRRDGYGDLQGGYMKLEQETFLGKGKWAAPAKLLPKDFKGRALLEDPDSGELIPVAKRAEVEKALKAKGIKFAPHADGSRSNGEAKLRERKARIETAARLRILAAIRQQSIAREFTLEDTQLVARTFFDRLQFDSRKRLVDARMADAGEPKPKGHEYVDHWAKRLDAMTGRELAALMLDIALIQDCHVASYWSGDVKDLHATAARVGVDHTAIRKQVKDEFEQKAKR